jgi:hypothetical protein
MKFRRKGRSGAFLILLGLFAVSAIAIVFLNVPSAKAATPLPLSGGPGGAQLLLTQNADYNISPHQVNVSGNYRYVSPQGNITFSSSNNAFTYENLAGTTAMKGSLVTIKLNGATYGIPTGGTTYSVKSTEFSETYALDNSLSVDCGTMMVSLNLSSWEMTFNFTTTSSCGSYHIMWLTVGAGNYCATLPDTTGTYANSTGTFTSLGNVTEGFLEANVNGTGISTTVNFANYGTADLRCGTVTINSNTIHGMGVIFGLNVATVDPSVVQYNTCGGTYTSGVNYSCAYSSNVTAGDGLVVAMAERNSSDLGTFTISDSEGNSFTRAVFVNNNVALEMIWYAKAGSSAVDTVTVTASGSGNTAAVMYIYEVNVVLQVVGTGTGSGSGSGGAVPATTNSVSFSSYAFSVAIAVMGGATGSAPQYPGESGYTIIYYPGGFSDNSASIYSVSGVSSPTEFTIVGPTYLGLVQWVDVGVVFIGVVNVPINLSVQNGATVDSAVVSCTGGGGTYTTSAGTQTFVCQFSSTVTVTLTAGGTNNHWCFSGQCTNSESFTSCSGGTCSLQSYNYWEQFQNTYPWNIAAGGVTTGGLTWTFTGYQSGSSGQTVCTSSPSSGASAGSCTGWGDYNEPVTAPASPSGSPSGERFENSVGSSSTVAMPTTGGNTFTPTSYYRQEQTTYQASTNGNGPPTWDSGLSVALTGTYLGTGSTTICTISPLSGTTSTAACSGGTSGWANYNTAVTIAATMSGSPSNIRWKVYGTSSWTETSGGNTVTATEYKQLQNTYVANPTAPTTFSASIDFLVTGTVGGIAGQEVCLVIVPSSPSSGSYSCTGFADYDLAASLPAQSSGNPPGYTWAATSTRSFTDTTGSNTHTTNYIEDDSNTYNANPHYPTTFTGSITFTVTGTIGGVGGSTVCTITIPASPSAGLYGCSGPTDPSTVATISATSGSNPTDVRWEVLGTNSWTDTTGGNSHTANYYEQLQNMFNANPAGAATVFTPGISFVVTGTYLGTTSTTICTITVPGSPSAGPYNCSGYADYDTAVNMPEGVTAGMPANERWLASGTTSWTDTTGNNTHTTNYYEQLQNTYRVLPSSGVWSGGITITPTGTYTGTAGTGICTISPISGTGAAATCQGWSDYDMAVTFPAVVSSSNGNWAAQATYTFTDVTGGNTHTVDYLFSGVSTVTQPIRFILAAGESGAPFGTFILSGCNNVPNTVLGDGTYHNVTATASCNMTIQVQTDGTTTRYRLAASAISFTLPLCSSGVCASSSTTYYYEFGIGFSYTLVGGGSPTPPTLTYSTADSSGATTILSQASTVYWVNYNSVWTMTPNPLSGSTGTERWSSISTLTASAMAAATVNPYFYHQYLYGLHYTTTGGTPAGGTNPTVAITQYGGTSNPTMSTSIVQFWLDAGSTTYPEATWYSDQLFSANPNSVIISSSTSSLITYSVYNAPCNLNEEPWTLLTTDCLFPAGAATYGDAFGAGNAAVGLPIFFFAMSVLPCLLIAIRQHDARIAIVGLIAFQGLFATELPGFYSELLFFLVGLQFVGLILSAFRGRTQ